MSTLQRAILRYSVLTAVILTAFAGRAFCQSYVLLGWNDLGMHCANKDFSRIAILPPYNNIYAQLIMKVPGQNP